MTRTEFGCAHVKVIPRTNENRGVIHNDPDVKPVDRVTLPEICVRTTQVNCRLPNCGCFKVESGMAIDRDKEVRLTEFTPIRKQPKNEIFYVSRGGGMVYGGGNSEEALRRAKKKKRNGHNHK